MWYAAQTLTGKEEAACVAIGQAVDLETRCQKPSDEGARVKPILERCFVPRYKTMRKREGELVACTESLFPGYLIVETNRVEDLASCIRRRLRNVQMVGSRSKSFVPLSDEETEWIDVFTNGGNDVIGMSTGLLNGDAVEVVEGPLVGHEGWIQGVSHRKKVAYLEMKAFGRTIQAQVGLRVVRKRPKA